MSVDWKALYPFSSHEIRLGGYRYHYVDEGGGEPLLLVHGNPTWSFMWRNLILALRDRYRVIAVDHIGCGLSDKPERYPYRLGAHIENLFTLVRTLDLHDITLIGHDWGGAIGIGAALQSPNRFARFVMLNTAAFPAPHIPARIRACRVPLVGTIAIRGLNLFLRGTLRMAIANRDRLSPEARAGYLAPYNSWSNRVAIDRFVKDIPMSPKHPSYKLLVEIEFGLPTFHDHPWLLIWGMQDWCFTPWFLDQLTFRLELPEVHRLYSAGHLILEDAGEQVQSILDDFLLRHLITRPGKLPAHRD